MPITRCPGCGADLDVPTTAPGGAVECPYCRTQFSPGRRGAPAGGRRRTRGAPRDDYDDYDDRPRRPRRKQDLGPILLVIGVVVLFGGALIFFFAKQTSREERAEQRRQEILENKQPAYQGANLRPDSPEGHSFSLANRLQKGSKISFNKLDYNGHLSYHNSANPDPEQAKSLWSLSYSVGGDINCELIEDVVDGVHHHFGRYHVLSYQKGGRTLLPSPVWIEARFQTNERGRPVGEIRKTGGKEIPEVPHLINERGYGILTGDEIVREKETWGTERLPDGILERLAVSGVDLRSLPPKDGGRRGGWKIHGRGSNLIKREDGSWERSANVMVRLLAVENRHRPNGTWKGAPADISASILWQGTANYMLYKRMLSEVTGLSVTAEIVVRTDKGWHHWTGTEYMDAQFYKED